MIVVPFKYEHLLGLAEQEATAYLRPYVREENLRALENEFAYTGMVDERPVACVGIIKYWEGRGEAWAFLAGDCRPWFTAIHKASLRALDFCGIRRVEAVVDAEFAAGHRWVKSLGFKVEAERLAAYRPTGGDCTLYARVN